MYMDVINYTVSVFIFPLFLVTSLIVTKGVTKLFLVTNIMYHEKIQETIYKNDRNILLSFIDI